MLEKLRLIKFQILPETDEVISLANEYIKGGVLKEKAQQIVGILHTMLYIIAMPLYLGILSIL